MIHAFLALTVFAILFPALANASYPAQRSDAMLQGVNQEDLLWWLPADTESVVVARGPFRLQRHSDDDDDQDRKLSQAEIIREFEQQPLELLYSDSLDLASLLQGSTVALAMQGSRHFRDPLPGFEVMDFQGCSIVIFDSRFGERGNDLMRTLAKAANSTQIVAETRVLVVHHKYGDAEWNTFIALPWSNVLLAANNLPYLQEVLERMTQRKGPRALPEQLPEWHFLDPSIRFWGLRHYDRSRAKEDPTSPYSDNRTFGPGDQQATGVLFALEASNQKRAVVTYLSGNDAKIREALNAGSSSEEALMYSSSGHEIITRDGGKTFEDETPEEGVKYRVELRSPAPGVLERAYTVERPTALSYFILNMEMSLGRGMWF